MESISVTYEPEDIQQSLSNSMKKLGLLQPYSEVAGVYRLLVVDIRQKQLPCLGIILELAN
jgi:hypothetical protein